MDRIDELEARVFRLESAVMAVVDVVNKLIEDMFEPEFVQKIDKLAADEIAGVSDRHAS